MIIMCMYMCMCSYLVRAMRITKDYIMDYDRKCRMVCVDICLHYDVDIIIVVCYD